MRKEFVPAAAGETVPGGTVPGGEGASEPTRTSVSPVSDAGSGAGSLPPAGASATGSLTVRLKMLDDGIDPPQYAHPGDAGADLRTRVDLVLAPGERVLAPTGVSIALPEGYVALIHPRSGLATRHGLSIVNSPGTVDAGYRGELAVTLINTDRTQSIRLSRGDRIAQMVIQRVEHAQFVPVADLPDSVRGTGGFGSTGGFTAPAGQPGASTETTDTAASEVSGGSGSP